MKAIIFLVATTFLGWQTFAQKSASDNPYMTRSLSGENIQFVEAATSGGSIMVVSVPNQEARLEIYIKPNNSSGLSQDEIENSLKNNYELDIAVSSGKLKVIARQKSNFIGRKSLSVSYKIYVPKNVSTDLKTSGGSISLTGLNGNQNFRTSGGSLNIDNLSGKINGKTSGGSIVLKNSSNEINLSTSGGSIKAENSNGNIVLQTSGGSLKLNELNGNIDARTSGGSVEANNISGDLIAKTSGGSIKMNGLACNLETSTSGGTMDIAFSEPVKSIRIKNAAGNVRLQLPGSQGIDLDLTGNKVNTGNLKNFDGSIQKNSVEGKLNGGGNSVNVSTASGSITLVIAD